MVVDGSATLGLGYAAFSKCRTWLIHSDTWFHLGKIWATK
jgi:hypothetical protein